MHVGGGCRAVPERMVNWWRHDQVDGGLDLGSVFGNFLTGFSVWTCYGFFDSVFVYIVIW